uniref:Uncharacterized protein n=1 Tax=Anopheles funestus TaxID=62324 RepID=A0A182S154_ANOFN
MERIIELANMAMFLTRNWFLTSISPSIEIVKMFASWMTAMKGFGDQNGGGGIGGNQRQEGGQYDGA